MEHVFPGGFVLEDNEAFPLGTDAIVLADFVQPPPHGRICDLGCGCGAIGLLLCTCSDAIRMTGIEIRPSSCETARQNAARNGLGSRADLLCADLREIRTLLPPGGYQLAVANPPYFPDGGASPAGGARRNARTEQSASITDFCRAAAWLLDFGSRFCVVYRPERLAELICAMRGAGLEPKRIRFVRHQSGAPVSLLLLEAKKGGRPGLRYEPDLLLCQEDGTPSAEFRRIYHLEGDD